MTNQFFMDFMKNASFTEICSIFNELWQNIIKQMNDMKIFSYWSTPKNKPKHKLEKWFIISSDDGVRPSVQNKTIKELNHFSS